MTRCLTRVAIPATAVAALAAAGVGLAAVSGVAAVPAHNTEIYSVAADGSERTNLSRHPASDAGPAVSPDGRQIAFVSDRDGYDAVYVMNAAGGGQEQVVGRIAAPAAASYRIDRLAWARTGSRVLFGLTQPPVGSLFETSYYYVVDVSTRKFSLLGGIGCGGDAAFSPDGRLVAYNIFYCRGGAVELKVVRADGGLVRTVANGSLVGWAPRGRRILFLQGTRSARGKYVGTVAAVGGHRWVLGGLPASAAAWAPSGRLIAFSRSNGTRRGVYVVPPGGRRPRRLVALANIASIAWSPNGAWLALTTARPSTGAGVTIYVVPASGRDLRRVADARTPPVWSRSSRHFAFEDLDGAARVATPPGRSTKAVTDPAVDALGGRLEWGAGDRLVFSAGTARARLG